MIKILRISIALIFILSLSILTLPLIGSAKEVIKVAHVEVGDTAKSVDHAVAVAFKHKVETGTEGEIEVKIFPGAVLGGNLELMNMLKAGQIDIFISPVGGIGSVFPEIGILDMPFVFPNETVVWEVFDGWFGDKMKNKILEKTGVRCLEIIDFYFFHLTNNKRPINSVSDMKGLKFRVMPLKSHIEIFKLLGASAITIPWPEVYSSLQTGVVDGQTNPITSINYAKLYEVQKYLTLSGHIWATHWFLLNEKWYQTLTEEQKGIVKNAAKFGKMCGRGYPVHEIEEAAPAVFKNMKVNILSQKAKDEFAAVLTPGMKKWVKNELGEEGVALQEDFFRAVKEARDKTGF